MNMRNFAGTHQLLWVALLLLGSAGTVFGAAPRMEIFYLPHRPAMAVVSQIERVVADYPQLVVKKYSFDDPAAAELLEKYQLRSHMPVAIFIDGRNNFEIDGRRISLRNFPKGDAFVPTFAGEWDYADLRRILRTEQGQR